MDRSNMSWNNKITDLEILNEHFSVGYLLNTNSHIPELEALRKKVLATYEVTARFEYLGFNGQNIYCNGQTLVYRSNKMKPVKYGKGVELIDGQAAMSSGSNKYPTVRFKNDYCVLKFTSYGLPFVSSLNGWGIHIIEINQVELF